MRQPKSSSSTRLLATKGLEGHRETLMYQSPEDEAVRPELNYGGATM